MKITIVADDGNIIEEWLNGEEGGDNDGFDADWCIEHNSLGIDLPQDIVTALHVAQRYEQRVQDDGD